MLTRKIADKSAVVAVIGLGKMGLPSALKIADAGFRVIGIDVNADVVKALDAGKSPYLEPGIEERLGRNRGSFKATLDYSRVKDADVVLCIVPTLITQKKDVDYSVVKSAFSEIAKHLRGDSLVMFESNVTPGVTEGLVLKALESRGAKHGRDFLLAYAPIQGKAGRMFRDLEAYERVVGGITPEARDCACLLLDACGYRTVKASNCKAVELGKLFANIFKDINIASANELAGYCEKQGIDVREVVRYVNMIPGIHLFEPGIGVGGNCLPVDPYFYIHDAKRIGVSVEMPKVARKINDERPKIIAKRIAALAKKEKRRKIVLLGIAFRPDTHETAYSPAIEIYKILRKRFDVAAYDPLVGEARMKKLGIRHVGSGDVADRKALVVKLVNHSVFARLDAVDAERLI